VGLGLDRLALRSYQLSASLAMVVQITITRRSIGPEGEERDQMLPPSRAPCNW
jgi:hypothetical protein